MINDFALFGVKRMDTWGRTSFHGPENMWGSQCFLHNEIEPQLSENDKSSYLNIDWELQQE
jgi:hypothetical protein